MASTDEIDCLFSEQTIKGLSLDYCIKRSNYLVDRAIERYPTQRAIVALMSGGNDSTTFCHMMKDRVTAIAHINTGIGVTETTEFVRDTVRSWGLPLIEVSPPPGSTYDELVMEYGMPGPPQHFRMYNNLKERGLRQVRRMFVQNGRSERIIFLAGMRLLESKRRMGNAQEMHRDGSTVWVSPIVHWTKEHMAEYRERCGDVPHNEVTDHLHMSGECLCGAFASPGELDQLELFYPATAQRIKDLECRAREAGVHAVWGTRPPRKSEIVEHGVPGPLCSSCPTRVGTES